MTTLLNWRTSLHLVVVGIGTTPVFLGRECPENLWNGYVETLRKKRPPSIILLIQTMFRKATWRVYRILGFNWHMYDVWFAVVYKGSLIKTAGKRMEWWGAERNFQFPSPLFPLGPECFVVWRSVDGLLLQEETQAHLHIETIPLFRHFVYCLG
jgi:hypothetical protein